MYSKKRNVICLWSCPRNVSTALMYSFAQRDDIRVFDEVLYGYYLCKKNLNHPGKEEIISTMECNKEKVINDIILKDRKHDSFHKLMTHFLLDIDLNFLSNTKNIIFIRDPKEIINSYTKVIKNISIEDIGIKQQFDLYNHLKKTNNKPIVLDSKYLLMNPKGVLQKVCSLIGINYDSKMLEWNKGPKKYDGIWAKYWYQNVHRSTGFMKYKSKNILLDDNYQNIYQESLSYYEYLNKKSII